MKFNTMMAAFGTLAVLPAVLAAAPAQADIVYAIDITSTVPEVTGELSPLSDTISGTITSDGTIGVLQSSDILSYDLLLTDNLRPASNATLIPANSELVYDVGNGLSATATALSFDFSDIGAGFLIQGTTYGIYSGHQYFCLQATTGACIAGETIVPDYYATDGVSATGLIGPQPLNPAVPEPATWATMLLGLGLTGFALRRSGKARPQISYG